VDSSEIVVVAMGSLVIMAGVVIIWLAMVSRRHFREMEHRERLAMIERGLVPSPESDPQAFERAISMTRRDESQSSSRARSAGVMMIALGFGFMFLLSFTAGEPGVGIGIGGAFAILGVAFFVNAMLSSKSTGYTPPSYTPPAYTPRSNRPEQRDPPSTFPS
jgi:Domain of unknown function (DUF6249)